jgi:hypothetical protein
VFFRHASSIQMKVYAEEMFASTTNFLLLVKRRWAPVATDLPRNNQPDSSG